MFGSSWMQARRSIPAYILLAVLVLVTSIFSSSFRSGQNFADITTQLAPLAFVAIGQTIVILQAGIDLSIGSVVSLSTVLMALYSGNNVTAMIIAVVLVCAVGILVGLLNGVGIVYFRVPPLIMTLGTEVIVKGVALYLMPSPGGAVNSGFAGALTSDFGNITVMLILTILLYALFTFVFQKTKFGRYTYAVGGDKGDVSSARKAGIPVNRTQILGYVVCSLMGALGGLLLAANIYSGDPVIGDTFSLDSITAVIVGGTSLFGGVGTAIGSFAGVVLISIIGNILNMWNVPSFYQYIVKGVILVTALLLYQLRARRGRS
ncbi:ABC transporter permease [Alicyclobacillus dauci]|uniref:Autoinducer 2 import system permease protein LsrD n=1 Tax=Alicyclobacillus dauci TaxID=1475485 RepID=A0ABY6Z320_9BACL|nr:ABC transporter permease [Alicyclobacillus dauci]WAH36365.1 ABC transporter permease [Alicyclobacillus dauci]WAH39369.1 ABC transporter permease [Alicyclobacillus dauci]